ncbi:metalloregulator ArsR/SmtB family transcription factor [Paenibacillus lautus]|uniref:ArsR/SmtB family transcription factor n=1 Tax=Paenibacillus lautus TaxID=1401 RepID=UPI001BCF6F79|nr:metalloregulator ArsR/SmtB family transcription factor [Paenibacillus lautus]
MCTNTLVNQITLLTLAGPNRSNIVELLKKAPKSVREIVKALSISQPHVSRHLRILSEAGIVRSRSKAQLRIYLSLKRSRSF